MRLRKNLLPKKLSDLLACLFVLLIIPITYYFEVFVVLPTFYRPWCFSYLIHFTAGSFIMANITSNLIALMTIDSSIQGIVLPGKLQPDWKFCSVCESVSPPRSWHCRICKVCILKRDHHCMFSACCVGHQNQRYFLMLVFYLFIATAYATVFNHSFVWSRIEFNSYKTIFQMVFPLAMLFVEWSIQQVYLMMYLLNVIAFVLTGILLYYHARMVLKGTTTHERNKESRQYDLGLLKNLKVVLGERWYLTWISPFVHSKLPGDGIVWEVRDTWKTQ